MPSCLLCCCCCQDKDDNEGAGEGRRSQGTADAAAPVAVAGLLHPHADPNSCHKPTRDGIQASQGELQDQRRAFWETAPHYGGRRPAWDVLRTACECKDKNLRIALCTSAGLLLPSGSLREVYDGSGFRYEVPDFCLSDPIASAGAGMGRQKEKAEMEGSVKLTLRFANNLDDTALSIKRTATLGELVMHIDQLDSAQHHKEVLFFHQGQGPLAHDTPIGEVIDGQHGLIQVLLR